MDWFSLILGAALSLLASIIAALALGPVLEILAGYHIIRIFSGLRHSRFRDKVFDGVWEQCWYVKSDRFPSENTSQITIYRFLNLIAAEFSIEESGEAGITHRAVARISGNRITGRWQDPHPMGYHGPFQLIVSPTKDVAEGIWSGFSSSGVVKADKWTWRKVCS